MKIFEVNTENVVIGSNSEEEHKFQAIAFMERIYCCIVEDNDYSSLGYSNIDTYTHNLMCELRCLEKLKKYHYNDIERYNSLVSAIKCNLRSLKKSDSKEYFETVKKLCLVHWEDILKKITNRYNLEYKRI